jgi:hypothetical protein
MPDTIIWHEATAELSVDGYVPMIIEQTFILDDVRSWKGVRITGTDIAEMIAHDHFDTGRRGVFIDNILHDIVITSPKRYAGRYQITVDWEPHFLAKKISP